MNKENNILKWIILLVIVIIILIIVLMLFLNKTKQKGENETQGNNNINTSNKTIEEIQAEIDEAMANAVLPSNLFEPINVTDEVMTLRYLADYKEKIEKDTRKAYSLLDEEYRNKRFGSLDNYMKYVEKHLEEIKKATIQKYQVKEKEGYTQYVAIDQFGNYYIFRETAIMQYTVILDDYTLDTEEYITKYNASSEQEKTALCIQRFVKATLDENYTFAYGMLSKGFKNNYFKTQEDFEIYAKSFFKGRETIEYKEFNNEGNIYTCKVKLTNPQDVEQTTSKTFIVRLGEGTTCEMSFNM